MNYQLKSQFSLHGWYGAECGLLNHSTGTVSFIDPIKFKHLLLFSGNLDCSTFIPQITLDKYCSEGLIEPCESSTRTEAIYTRHQNRYVEYAHWSITGACNFKCRHCYMEAPCHRQCDISTDEAKRMIQQLSECGIYRVKITGGEPLLRKDFWQLIDELQHNHIVVDEIYTNGWFITENVLRGFKERGLTPTINMSYDGLECHDWMRRVVGAEQAVIQAFKLCDKLGFRTGAEMCVHKGNLHTLRDTVNFLAEIGVSKLKVGSLFDTELWINNCESNYLSNEDFFDTCLKYIPQYFEDGCPLKLSISNIFKYDPDTNSAMTLSECLCEDCTNSYLCPSARKTLYIAPNGTLLPCMAATALSQETQAKFPNLTKTNLSVILNQSYLTDFIDLRTSDLFAHNEECARCEYRHNCKGGCRVEAMRSGTPFGKDNVTCYVYQRGIPQKVKDLICKLRKG